LSEAEATCRPLHLSQGQPGLSRTANGVVRTVELTLSAVRVGNVEVANVRAVVIPAPMPYILLGNSFLSRFQMRRDNDVMRLTLR
jgi:aspartyl protease family protein